MQIVDGFLRSHTIECVLVVASDADPGRGMSEHLPFSPVGAALLCKWTDDDCGLGAFHWASLPDEGENFRATVGLEDARNVLRFSESAAMDEQFAAAAAQVASNCLDGSSLGVSDVDVIVTAPARHAYRTALADRLHVPVERIVVADDERVHTASLVAALGRGAQRVPEGGRILLIVTGAGITAGAALYQERAHAAWRD